MADIEFASDAERCRRQPSDDDLERPRLLSSVVVVAVESSENDQRDENVSSLKRPSPLEDRRRKSSADSLPEVDSPNEQPSKRSKAEFRDSRSTQRDRSKSPSQDDEKERNSRRREDYERSASRSRLRRQSSSSSRSSKPRSESRHHIHHSSSSRSKRKDDDGVFRKPPSPMGSRTASSSGYSSRGSDKGRTGGKKSPPSRLGTESENSETNGANNRDAPKGDHDTGDRLSLLSTTSALAEEVDELEATSVVRDILKMFDDLKTTIKRAKSPSNLEEGEVLDEQELRVQEAKLREVENLSLDEMLMRIVAHVDEQEHVDEDEEENMSPVSGDDAAEPGEITPDEERQEERWRKKQAERASREASRQSISSVVTVTRSTTSHRSERKTSPRRREIAESIDIDEDERERLRFAFKAASPSAILRDAMNDVEKIIRPGSNRGREDTYDSEASSLRPDDSHSHRARHASSRRSPSVVSFHRIISNRGLGYRGDERDDDTDRGDDRRSRRDETYRSFSRQTVEKDGDFWSRLDASDDRHNRRREAGGGADYERAHRYYDDDDEGRQRSIDFRAPSYAASSRSIRSEAHIAENRHHDEDSQMHERDRYSNRHRDGSVVVDDHRSHRSVKHSKVGGSVRTHSPAGSAGEAADEEERKRAEEEGDTSRFSPSGRLRGVRSDSAERRKRRAEEKRGKGLRSMSADTLNSIFVDRRKLREVAIRNAVEMRKRGLIPLYCPRIPGRVEKQLARVKLKELTSICRDIAAGRKPRKSFADVKHPFQMSDKTLAINPHNTIDVNVRFALPADDSAAVTPTSNSKVLPPAGALGSLTTVTSRVTRDLRLAFPVSTGVQHRNVEVWFPQFQEEKRDHEQKGKDREVRKKAREEKEAKDAAAATAAEEGAVSTAEPEPTANDKVLSAKAIAKIVQPDLPIDLTRDYNSLVFQRLRFQKELQENPENTDAQQSMNRTQQLMMDWAVNYHGGSANYLTAMLSDSAGKLPGQGVDGAYGNPYGPDFISPAAMGPQAWARSDQLIRATPVVDGIGVKLLQKMGWSAGIGIGKRQRGMLEPLRFIVKLNRRGLSTAQDYMKNQQHSQNTLKQQLGKSVARCVIMATHPCSALNEFCTKRGFGTPVFQEADDSGCAGDNPLYSSFMYQVIINGVAYKPPRRTRNKKEAKKICAEHALETLGVSYRGQQSKV